jgi:predicted house-cleaning NTP pyrophosphatase (Maf/HAM1 superfamily)
MKNAEASKNVSETPETDMLLSNQRHDCVTYDEAAEQLADLCEKLERERDEGRGLFQAAMELLKKYKDVSAEARDAFAIATDQCVVAQAKLREAIEERDEARAMLERKWHEEGAPLVRMMRERDEARLQYSTTLVFCQSLVKARLEEWEGAE